MNISHQRFVFTLVLYHVSFCFSLLLVVAGINAGQWGGWISALVGTLLTAFIIHCVYRLLVLYRRICSSKPRQ